MTTERGCHVASFSARRATAGRSPIGVVLGASVLCHALASTPAAAQSETVEQRIAEAHWLLHGGRCDEAAVAFAAIWEGQRVGRALAELGLAEACSSHWVEAERDLSQALGTTDPWVAENRAVLSENVETMGAHLATLIVDASGPAPDATQIVLNGQRRGNAGAELRVVAGTVVIEVRAAGFASMHRTVELEPRQRARERFELVAERAAIEAPPDRGAAPPTPVERWARRQPRETWLETHGLVADDGFVLPGLFILPEAEVSAVLSDDPLGYGQLGVAPATMFLWTARLRVGRTFGAWSLFGVVRASGIVVQSRQRPYPDGGWNAGAEIGGRYTFLVGSFLQPFVAVGAGAVVWHLPVVVSNGEAAEAVTGLVTPTARAGVGVSVRIAPWLFLEAAVHVDYVMAGNPLTGETLFPRDLVAVSPSLGLAHLLSTQSTIEFL